MFIMNWVNRHFKLETTHIWKQYLHGDQIPDWLLHVNILFCTIGVNSQKDWDTFAAPKNHVILKAPLKKMNAPWTASRWVILLTGKMLHGGFPYSHITIKYTRTRHKLLCRNSHKCFCWQRLYLLRVQFFLQRQKRGRLSHPFTGKDTREIIFSQLHS